VPAYVNLCEAAREEALALVRAHAAQVLIGPVESDG
jgi:hypothetical protein